MHARDPVVRLGPGEARPETGRVRAEKRGTQAETRRAQAGGLMGRHHWVVDAIEEDAATLEREDGSLITVPRGRLPAGTVAGEVLRVTTGPGDESQPVTLERDPEATAAALRRSAAQVRRPRGMRPDPGGDITL